MKVCIVGAGVVGRAVARALAGRGDHVVLASPEPRAGAGLWRRADALTGAGIREALYEADVVVYAATAPKQVASLAKAGPEQVARAARQGAVGRFVWVQPVGVDRSRAPAVQTFREAHPLVAAHAPDLRVVGLPLLFGDDDKLLAPWLAAARSGKAVPQPPDLRLRPLWCDDAARLVVRAVDGTLPERVGVQGPRPVRLRALAEDVAGSFGVGVSRMKRSVLRPWADLLADQADAPDDWEGLDLGRRRDVEDHLRTLV